MISMVRTITAAESPYTPIRGDRLLLCDATAGPITVLLWLCATSPDGWKIAVNKIDASLNPVTLQPSATDQINGIAGSVVLAADGDSLSLITDRVGWWSFGEGATGLIGPLGLASPPGLDGEDGETFVIPGPQGPQGPAGAGGSGATGTALLDFGAFPGGSDASVVVTGQAGLVAGSVVQAWIRPETTADHSADEHLVETLAVVARDLVAGVGFTIAGVNTNTLFGGGIGTRLSGAWSVAWRWS